MNTIKTTSDAPDFTSGGTCCTASGTNGGIFDPSDADCPEDCRGVNKAFCAVGKDDDNSVNADIANKIIREFLTPSDATYCPKKSE